MESKKFVAKMCGLCNKPLKPIGEARKNGNFGKEWASRKYHKKCYMTIPLTRLMDNSV